MSQDFKKGTRVRVVAEAELQYDQDSEYGSLNLQDLGAYSYLHRHHIVSIETVAPPVETFGPGDVVRHKRNEDTALSLNADGGYTYVGAANKGLTVDKWGGHIPITSENFDRVGL